MLKCAVAMYKHIKYDEDVWQTHPNFKQNLAESFT
jgi:hypothetical protein